MARRVTRSQQREEGGELERLAADMAAGRHMLLEIVAGLGIQVRRYKAYAGWIGEKAARLKLNGCL